MILDALPAGATVSGGTVSFTAAMPARIVARTATSPATSLYVQDGLIGHLDAIENGGAGVHNASPSTWTDLTGKHAFDCANGAAFSSDAWVGNASRYVKTTSPLSLAALKRKAFTLEMVIMHPETPIDPSGYEKWAVFGNDSKRQLMVEIRTMNSKNPVIQGLQYRTDGYNHACEVPNGKGTTTAWGRRHCVSVTCDGNSATLYLDGTNAIHTSSYGTVEPTMDIVAFGGYFTGSSPLSADRATAFSACTVTALPRTRAPAAAPVSSIYPDGGLGAQPTETTTQPRLSGSPLNLNRGHRTSSPVSVQAQTDYCNYNASGVVLYVGGNYNQNPNYGLFYLNGNNAATNKNANRGSRHHCKEG